MIAANGAVVCAVTKKCVFPEWFGWFFWPFVVVVLAGFAYMLWDFWKADRR